MESLNNPSFLDNQHPNVFDTKKFGFPAESPVMAAGTDSLEDTALRCRVLTRLYADDVSKVFAKEIRISARRWNNIEQSGKLQRDLAIVIARKWPGVSLDWVLRGKDDWLPPTTATELLAVYSEIEAERRPTRRRAS